MNAKEFMALPRNERRVFVAKDVLKQLNKLSIKQGQYVVFDAEISGSVWGLPTDGITDKFKNQELKDILHKVRKDCEVCALGACFLSIVGITDKFEINRNNVNSYNEIEFERIEKHLKKVFTSREMALIETAFEGVVIRDEYILENDQAVRRAKDFACQYADNKDRLRAIMKNIIKNNGKFCP
jgi:hypothetical protein